MYTNDYGKYRSYTIDIDIVAICLLFFAAWDCSAWVRTYALFLEVRLECYRVLKYDVEAERLPSKASNGQDKVCNAVAYVGFNVNYI